MRTPNVYRAAWCAAALVVLCAGCAANPDETPAAESAAAARTVNKATDLSQQSGQRVRDGNAVLDGK